MFPPLFISILKALHSGERSRICPPAATGKGKHLLDYKDLTWQCRGISQEAALHTLVPACPVCSGRSHGHQGRPAGRLEGPAGLIDVAYHRHIGANAECLQGRLEGPSRFVNVAQPRHDGANAACLQRRLNLCCLQRVLCILLACSTGLMPLAWW